MNHARFIREYLRLRHLDELRAARRVESNLERLLSEVDAVLELLASQGQDQGDGYDGWLPPGDRYQDEVEP